MTLRWSHLSTCNWPRFLWDKTSRDYFDPDTVYVEAYQLPAKLAFTTRELISLSGAPKESQVYCSVMPDESLVLIVNNERLFSEPARLRLFPSAHGSMVGVWDFLKLHERVRRKGIGARAFICTARAASRLAITRIDAQALAISPMESAAGEAWSGAVAAVKFGFDGEIPAGALEGLPPRLTRAPNPGGD